MPERVYVFQHVACEDLGTFAVPLAARNWRVDYVRLFAGEPVPADAAAARMLIFLGGPMSVNDEAHYSYLVAEKALIRTALARQTPILGVCLGAQLVAAAAGARVYPAPQPEIGWAPITLTADGQQDALLGGLATLAAVFHWHGETFDVPAGATGLAASAVVPNQAFRLGSHVYALQFHLEVDQSMIASWMAAYAHDLGTPPAAAERRIMADTAVHGAALQQAAAEFMGRFLWLA